jgi:REP element-mobilizing transposase RayT
MARPLRIEFAGTLYHVTSRGDGRGAIYVQDQDRHVWLEMLGHVCERFNWVVHAYCQMGNTTTCWWKPRTGISPWQIRSTRQDQAGYVIVG